MKILSTILAIIGLSAFAHAADSTAYPLQTCVISGEKLGEMGKPYVFESNGHQVQLCCDHCKAKFDKDPEKYLKEIEDASKAK